MGRSLGVFQLGCAAVLACSIGCGDDGGGGGSTSTGTGGQGGAAGSGNDGGVGGWTFADGGAGAAPTGGMSATGGEGGSGPGVETLSITIDAIEFIKNGDLLGKGENTYTIKVFANGAEELTISDEVEAGDGDSYPIAQTVEISVPGLDTSTIEVWFTAADTGTGAEETVQASRVHEFIDTFQTWTDLGEDQTIHDEDGQLEVQVKYDFVVTPPSG